MPEFSFNTPLKMGDYLLSILLASQCRAARAMLGYSQQDLAKRSEVGSRTFADFETGTRTPHPRTLKAIREALEDAGVIFLPTEPTLGPGIRLKQADTPSLNLIPLEEALNLFMNEP